MLDINSLVKDKCTELNNNTDIVIPTFKYCGIVDGVPQVNSLYDSCYECSKIFKRVKAIMTNVDDYEKSVNNKNTKAKLLLSEILNIIFKDKDKVLLSLKEEYIISQLMVDTYEVHNEHHNFIHQFNIDNLTKMLNIIHISI